MSEKKSVGDKLAEVMVEHPIVTIGVAVVDLYLIGVWWRLTQSSPLTPFLAMGAFFGGVVGLLWASAFVLDRVMIRGD